MTRLFFRNKSQKEVQLKTADKGTNLILVYCAFQPSERCCILFQWYTIPWLILAAASYNTQAFFPEQFYRQQLTKHGHPMHDILTHHIFWTKDHFFDLINAYNFRKRISRPLPDCAWFNKPGRSGLVHPVLRLFFRFVRLWVRRSQSDFYPLPRNSNNLNGFPECDPTITTFLGRSRPIRKFL